MKLLLICIERWPDRTDICTASLSRQLLILPSPAIASDKHMNKALIEESVRDFLINEVFYDKALDTNALGPTDPLVGLLTSLDITRLVSFCEKSFGIEIPIVQFYRSTRNYPRDR